MRWSGSNELVGEEAEQRDVNERERERCRVLEAEISPIKSHTTEPIVIHTTILYD